MKATKTEIEVNKKQYQKAITEFSGYIFHRQENGRYFIKQGFSKYWSFILKSIGIQL